MAEITRDKLINIIGDGTGLCDADCVKNTADAILALTKCKPTVEAFGELERPVSDPSGMITQDEIAEIIAPGARPWSQNYKAARVKADTIFARLGDGWLAFRDAPKTGELVDLWVGGYRVADARYSAARDCWLTPHDTIVIGTPTHFLFPPSPPKDSA